MSINNIKIGVRLGFAFCFIIALLILVSTTASVKIKEINQLATKMIDSRYAKVNLALSVRYQVNERTIILRGTVIDYGRPQFNTPHMQKLHDSSVKIQYLINRITALQTTSIGQKKSRLFLRLIMNI